MLFCSYDISMLVKCVEHSFGFSETFYFACSSWFSEMIAYVDAMFDFIDFHRRVTNSSIK